MQDGRENETEETGERREREKSEGFKVSMA
jgi:hypothetical protein